MTMPQLVIVITITASITIFILTTLATVIIIIITTIATIATCATIIIIIITIATVATLATIIPNAVKIQTGPAGLGSACSRPAQHSICEVVRP